MHLPDRFTDETTLEAFMSAPSDALVHDLSTVPGDIVVLGVGGKMGPTLARMAKRADPSRRVIGVARFSSPQLRGELESHGVECVPADLLDAHALERLPDCPNVIYMAGRKFGARDDPAGMWAMNVLVPARVAQRYASSRIVAFSTGCVYPFVDVNGPGASEGTPVGPPSGEYANACVGRERMFEHFSARVGTPGRLLRLNYAIDTRYGVLHDIGRNVLAGAPVDLAMSHCNVIWQGTANEAALRALAHCTTPTSPLNVSGTGALRVRDVASAFGRLMGRKPSWRGREASTAWLVDTTAMRTLLGEPPVPVDTMIRWCADWLMRGLPTLGKPTHFEARDGQY